MNIELKDVQQALEQASKQEKRGYSMDYDAFMEVINNPDDVKAYLDMFNLGFMQGMEYQKARDKEQSE